MVACFGRASFERRVATACGSMSPCYSLLDSHRVAKMRRRSKASPTRAGRWAASSASHSPTRSAFRSDSSSASARGSLPASIRRCRRRASSLASSAFCFPRSVGGKAEDAPKVLRRSFSALLSTIDRAMAVINAEPHGAYAFAPANSQRSTQLPLKRGSSFGCSRKSPRLMPFTNVQSSMVPSAL